MEISILIVDDDKLLVDKLEETVAWDQIGISMVFTAYNIRQAQKILEEFSIQIMLCDIDMPQGSGLELLEWLRSKNMETECVFLSSYANFAYAQKAIRLLSREYLLKPISNQDLEQVLSKVTREIIQKKEVRKIPNTELNKENVWNKFLLEYQEQGLESLYKKEDKLFLEIIKIFINDKDEEGRKKLSLCKFALKSIQTEAVVQIADDEWGIVIKTEDDRDAVKAASKELAEYICRVTGQDVSIYVGNICLIADIMEEWKKLREVECRILPIRNGVVMVEEDIKCDEYETPSWKLWQKMSMTPEGLESVSQAVEKFLHTTFISGKLTKKQLRKFIREFTQFLYIYLADQKLNFSEVFDSVEFELKEKEANTFYEGCIEFVQFIFQTLQGNLKYKQNHESAIEYIMEYIDKNLDQELSRSVLAKKVYLSEDYVSKLFKAKTGMSLPNYIAIKRIEKAKEYLKHSNLTVSKIALEVGYNNFSYFSKTFRDIAGMTPNEYRNDKKAY